MIRCILPDTLNTIKHLSKNNYQPNQRLRLRNRKQPQQQPRIALIIRRIPRSPPFLPNVARHVPQITTQHLIRPRICPHQHVSMIKTYQTQDTELRTQPQVALRCFEYQKTRSRACAAGFPPACECTATDKNVVDGCLVKLEGITEAGG
jgi:hypothetical protein